MFPQLSNAKIADRCGTLTLHILGHFKYELFKNRIWPQYKYFPIPTCNVEVKKIDKWICI